MTVTFRLVTVADSISALVIPGVKVCDIDNIPEMALSNLPVFFPRPDNFITDMTFTRQTQGASAAMDVAYTLNYMYLHTAAGSGGGLMAVYEGLITNIVAILTAIFSDSNLVGAIDTELLNISNLGTFSDPARSGQFLGVEISLRVLEYIQ